MTQSLTTRVLIVAAVILLVVLTRVLPVGIWLDVAASWNELHPVLGALTYFAVTVVATIALVPGWISMMVAGLLFGVLPGLLYAVAGIVGGAFAAFLTGRGLARSWVEKRISDDVRLKALDDALDAQAFTIIVLTRLALVLPFNLLNYAYGITRVRAATYLFATAIGMLPAVALYVYLGTLTKDIGQILAGNVMPTTASYWITAIAAGAIVAVVFVVYRAAGRALRRRMRN